MFSLVSTCLLSGLMLSHSWSRHCLQRLHPTTAACSSCGSSLPILLPEHAPGKATEKWQKSLSLWTRVGDQEDAPGPWPSPGWCSHLGSEPLDGRSLYLFISLCNSHRSWEAAGMGQRVAFPSLQWESRVTSSFSQTPPWPLEACRE